MSHGTLSNEFPGWYITFQTDVLSQLPRPGELSEDVADGWHTNRESMKRVLREALLPPDNSAVEPAPVSEPAPQPLLIPVGTVNIAATMEPFVARTRFVVNTKKDAAVKISCLGDNFKAWFLGKTEAPFAGSTLKYGKLSRRSVDGPIITDLGGNEKAASSLAEPFALMAQQPNGEDGALLNNGWANIFYVEDEVRTPEDEAFAYVNVAGKKVVLRTVYVYWYGDGWSVHANPVSNPLEWNDDDQVFSRDSR
jgi:hypothetical protein